MIRTNRYGHRAGPQSLLKDAVRTVLFAAGLEVQRRRPRAAGYYPQVSTCQVQDLSFILELFLGTRERGQYVEVGAYDGITYSNTWGLAERGWDGLLIEPVPHLAALCRAQYAKHPRVKVSEVAIGARPGSLVLNLAGPYTTGDAALAEDYSKLEWAASWATGEKIEVSVQTLDHTLTTNGVTPDIDVLVVDVEGGEFDVFEGFDLEHWRPRLLIVELEDVHPILSTNRVAHARLAQHLVEQRYRVVYKDAVNSILVRDDIAENALSASIHPK